MQAARAIILSLFCMGFAYHLAGADTVYLEATFDDKIPDQPIGLGGAEAGEPVAVAAEVTAIVRTEPMPTPCLEIAKVSSEFAGDAIFRFVDHAGITDGNVTISAELWFPVFGEYFITVTDEGQPNRGIAGIFFEADGTVERYDPVTPEDLGTYQLDRLIPLILRFDMDAGTYELELDGEIKFADHPHGVESASIERLAFGINPDPGLDEVFYVDSISVQGTSTPVEKTTWGRIKNLLR
jgi:hypothetical protein